MQHHRKNPVVKPRLVERPCLEAFSRDGDLHINSTVIKLAHLQPFAGGMKRDCYMHPDDDNRIIKIIPPGKSPEVLHSRKIWIRRMLQSPKALDANFAEHEKFERIARKFGDLKNAFPHLVEYFGKIQTDLGEGMIFQAIKNYDGQISESVDTARKTGGYNMDELLKALKRFAAIRNDGIIFNDVGKFNVVVQVSNADHTNYKFWIIDGINCGPIIPISEYSTLYANARKAKKIWQMKRFIVKHFKHSVAS